MIELTVDAKQLNPISSKHKNYNNAFKATWRNLEKLVQDYDNITER